VVLGIVTNVLEGPAPSIFKVEVMRTGMEIGYIGKVAGLY
jgi:hypothetical protein